MVNPNDPRNQDPEFRRKVAEYKRQNPIGSWLESADPTSTLFYTENPPATRFCLWLVIIGFAIAHPVLLVILIPVALWHLLKLTARVIVAVFKGLGNLLNWSWKHLYHDTEEWARSSGQRRSTTDGSNQRWLTTQLVSTRKGASQAQKKDNTKGEIMTDTIKIDDPSDGDIGLELDGYVLDDSHLEIKVIVSNYTNKDLVGVMAEFSFVDIFGDQIWTEEVKLQTDIPISAQESMRLSDQFSLFSSTVRSLEASVDLDAEFQLISAVYIE